MPKYYGVIAPGIKTVTNDFNFVRRIKAMYPYPKFRKFYNERAAWDFVQRYKYDSRAILIKEYGNLWNCYVDMDYVIGDGVIYYTVKRHNLAALHFSNPPPNLCNTTDLTTFSFQKPDIQVHSIRDNIRAVKCGLDSLGGLLSVNIIVPDYSVYYALVSYSGKDPEIRDIQRSIKNRMGTVAYTVRR